MPDQPTIGADLRSAFPHRAGVPAWGAVLIAVSATLVGFAIEAGSGHQELGSVFAICYALGCIAAALAVRQSGIFSAVIQPPLLLFVAVPLGYFLMQSSSLNGLKDIAITCGYPLIERFPLMLFTSASVLLIGLVRWYFAMSAPAQPIAASARPQRPGAFAGLGARISSAFAGNGSEAEEAGAPRARPRHGIDRTSTTRRPRPAGQTRERAGSRRSRPPADGIADATPRPRRESARRPGRESDRDSPPRRRTREPRAYERETYEPPRTPPPPRRDPRERRDYRDGYPPRSDRGGPAEPYEADRHYRSRPDHDPYPPQGPRRRPTSSASESTHHPVSRVRYRDSSPDTDRPGVPRNRPSR